MEAEATAYSCARFLRALFEGLPGYIELRPRPESPGAKAASEARREADDRGRDLKTARVRRWLSLEDAIDVAEKVPDWARAEGYSAFFGALPRREPGAGRKRDVLRGRCLWADLDFKDFPDGWEEAREMLSRLRIEPSCIVETGHGFHAWYLLDEPADPEDIEKTNALLVPALRADPACKERARLMRLPGSWNVKEDEHRQARITFLDPDRRYTLGEIAEAARKRAREIEDEGTVEERGDPPADTPTAREDRPAPDADDDTPETFNDPATGAGPSDRYVEVTVDAVALDVSEAAQGSRNSTLNAGAFSLGRLVGAGALEEGKARDVLTQAGTAAGLSAGEIAQTVNSGLSAGIENPWEDNGQGPTAVAPRRNKNRHRKPDPRQAERPGAAIDRVWDALDQKADGLPKNSMRNACTVLELDPLFSGQIWFDDFAGKIMTQGGPLTDGRVVAIRHWLDEVYGMAIGKDAAHDALLFVAEKNRRHPLRERLLEIEREGFDGEPRCEHLLSRYFGAVDTGLTRAISRAFLVSCVVRAFEPGSKVDTVLILVGKQGVKKSTGLKALAIEPQWFSDSALDLRSKDCYQGLEGIWLYELAELDSMRRAESSSIKAFLSSQVDKFRPSYGRLVVERPRQCVFVGSTNAGEFISDRTGSRRLFPVEVGEIDLEGLKRDRELIWAEAIAWWRMGVRHWLEDDLADELAQHSEQYRQRDPWEGPILEWIRARFTPFKSETVLRDALNLEEKHRMSRADGMRIAGILKAAGCEKNRRRIDGVNAWWWSKPAAVIDLQEVRDSVEDDLE